LVINIRIISATTIIRDIRIISVRVMGVIILTSVIKSFRIILIRLGILEIRRSKVIIMISDIRDKCLQFETTLLRS